jgi:hypothetical protein
VKTEGKFKIGHKQIKQWLQDQNSHGLSRNLVPDLIELSFLLLKAIVNALMTLLEVFSVMGWIHK